jgi:ABC-type uncharacterized transport system substrate-binding protein
VSIADPVAGGLVRGLGRPGGNLTGFTNYEFSMGAKWLEILKELAPSTSRVSLMLDPDSSGFYADYVCSIQAAALASAVQTTLAPVRNSTEIDQVITAQAREAGGGLIVLPAAPITAHSQLIIDLAARHKMPAAYPFRRFVTDGGLVSYGTDLTDLFRRSAAYVDLILKGANPAELPVQLPTKFELTINVGTAKSLGITVPATLLARTDEVIE